MICPTCETTELVPARIAECSRDGIDAFVGLACTKCDAAFRVKCEDSEITQ